MDEEVDKIILQIRKDIRKNKELSDLADDYFENSFLTLDFCSALDACVKVAVDIQSILQLALRYFEHEHDALGEEASVKNYSRTLKELRNFRMAGDPFMVDFLKFIGSVFSQQNLMLARLQAKKRKLDNKLKVSNLILFVASPILNKHLRSLKRQREIISSIQVGTYILITDLDSTKVIVDKFGVVIENLLAAADYAILRGEEGVLIAVEEIKSKTLSFVETVDKLNMHADLCTRNIRRARAVISQRISNHPGS